MLEKRVKSRFSHRIIRCSPPSNISAYVTLARAVLKTPLTDAEAKLIQDSDEDTSETSLLSWRTAWDRSIDVRCSYPYILTN
jgi:origin recognition complex subunit 4